MVKPASIQELLENHWVTNDWKVWRKQRSQRWLLSNLSKASIEILREEDLLMETDCLKMTGNSRFSIPLTTQCLQKGTIPPFPSLRKDDTSHTITKKLLLADTNSVLGQLLYLNAQQCRKCKHSRKGKPETIFMAKLGAHKVSPPHSKHEDF